MKRVLIIIAMLLLILPINASAVTITNDGWYIVPSLTTSGDYAWGYYVDGFETMRYSTMIYAHRGWQTAPENSLESFKLTKQNGYYGFETDIRFTSDNVAVLCHDGTINRVARNNDSSSSSISGNVSIADHTLAELKAYRFNVTTGGDVLSAYNDNKITTFEDALKYAKNNKMTIAIELKEGTQAQIASLVNMVKSYHMDKVVKYLSYYPNLLRYVHTANPDENIQLLMENTWDYTQSEKDSMYNEFKSSENYVLINGVEGGWISHHVTPNLPSEASQYPMSNYSIASIQYTTYTVTFKNGNTTVSSPSCKVRTGATKCSVTTPAAVSKDGYTFKGWGTTSTCTSGTNASTSIEVSANTTLHACFVEKPKQTFTVTFKNGDTTVETKTCTTAAGGTKCNVTTPASVSKTGYTFKGWGTSSTCTSGANANTSLEVSANTTVHACFVEKPKQTYTVTFKDGDTNITTKTCTTAAGGTKCNVTTPASVNKDGYTFKGWGTTSTCTSGTKANTNIEVTANTSIYACLVVNSTPNTSDEGIVNPKTGQNLFLVLGAIALLMILFIIFYIKNTKVDK